jgi:RimJ/RimL family protein N-acetyltransferase
MSALVDPFPRQGPRVSLRRLRADDLRAFQAYRGDPEVGRFQGFRPMPERDASDFLLGMSTATPFEPSIWFQLGIADTATDELIGDLGLCVSSDGTGAHVGFSLRRASQGQGYATEAVREALGLVFERTSVERISGTADARNARSIALLLRVGMQKVSEVKTVFRGQPCEEYTYAITRQEHARRRAEAR